LHQLGQARIIVLAEQLEPTAGHVVELVVRLESRQAKGRAAFESEQVAGAATERLLPMGALDFSSRFR
jgi:hypothetical protein